MKIICISDTHNQLSKMKIPEGDLLIHAGDATSMGTLQEVITFSKEFRALPHPHKVFVPGNHDWLFEEQETLAREIMGLDVTVLIDQEITIQSTRIFGSPWQPTFCNWAFNVDRGKAIAKKWGQIPEQVDILVTHGPPHGILDFVITSEHCGCEELLKVVQKIQPHIHVFGHLHHGYGQVTLGKTQYVNASSCTEEYRPTNSPIIISHELFGNVNIS